MEMDPDDRIKKLLKKIREQGGNLTVPFTLISKSWFKSNKAIFALKGPGKYKDLSPKYKIQKVKSPPKGAGFIYPIFRGKTGRLERSITSPTDPDSINLIINKIALYLGTKTPYAGFHQSSAPRRIIPYRPIVLLGSEQVAPMEKRADYDRIENTLAGYYDQLLKQAAGGIA